MDADGLLALSRESTRVARSRRATAERLRRAAGELCSRMATQVREHPYQRVILLARGGSDGKSVKPEPRETTERRCPHCRSADGIKALGRIQIENGVVRSMYCCGPCDRAFVYIRRALG